MKLVRNETAAEIGSDTCGPTPPLSPRQRQILRLLRAGKSNKEIAAELDMGIGTVKQHLVALFRKLGVANRAMAISKSYALAHLDDDAQGELVSKPAGRQAPVLEERPSAVLSLDLVTDGAAPNDDVIKDLYRTFAEVAYDFGAIFLTHSGGRCEIIFGVPRVRRHDVLRAIRAAVAVSEDFKSKWAGNGVMRAGLAFGLLTASVDHRGNWTGEAIAGNVIKAARQLAADAEPETLRMAEDARAMISFLGMKVEKGVPETIPLDRGFLWKRAEPVAPKILRSRSTEMETLKFCLSILKAGRGGLALIEGETGMGRSALLSGFADICRAERVGVQMWMCSMPDSQPGSASIGRMERLAPPAIGDMVRFGRMIARATRSGPVVVLIDDSHFLPADVLAGLAEKIEKMAAKAVFFAVAARGRLALPEEIRESAKTLHLHHMVPSEARALANDLLPDEPEAAEWIVDISAGVPGFLAELARHHREGNPRDREDERRHPPLTLFSLVMERIDGIDLNHVLLRLVATAPGPVELRKLRREWSPEDGDFDAELERCERLGILRRGKQGLMGRETVRFRHPLVRWVLSSAAARSDRLAV